MYLACDQLSEEKVNSTKTVASDDVDVVVDDATDDENDCERKSESHTPGPFDSATSGLKLAPILSAGTDTTIQSSEHHNMPMTISDWKFLEALWKHNHAKASGQIAIDWRGVVLSEADHRAEPAKRVLNHAFNCIGRAVQVRCAFLHGENWFGVLGDNSERLIDELVLLTCFVQMSNTLTTVNLDFEEKVSVDLDAVWSCALQMTASLSSLHFNRLTLTDAGAKVIATSLVANRSLVDVSLSRAEIGEEGATALAEFVSNSFLTRFCLSFNAIGKAGVLRFYECLNVNRTLTDLDVLHNAMTDWDARDVETAASAVERHATLQTVAGISKSVLAASKFVAHDMDEFHVCVWSVLLRKATKVAYLDLTSNSIGSGASLGHQSTSECHGVSFIVKLLIANSSIQTLVRPFIVGVMC
jgi:hypothetical protein